MERKDMSEKQKKRKKVESRNIDSENKLSERRKKLNIENIKERKTRGKKEGNE